MSPENQTPDAYERKVTGAERFFSHAPFSTVTLVARIKGNVSEEMLRAAVENVQLRHVSGLSGTGPDGASRRSFRQTRTATASGAYLS